MALLHINEYAEVPPLNVISIVPVEVPKQTTGVICDVISKLSGCVITMESN
jgi:hypothetical protein